MSHLHKLQYLKKLSFAYFTAQDFFTKIKQLRFWPAPDLVFMDKYVCPNNSNILGLI